MVAFARSLALAAALAVAPFVAAGEGARDAGPYHRFGFDLMAGTPSALTDVFRSAFFGASFRYMITEKLGLGLDYAFMDLEYYYPEGADGPWAGPVPWSSVPDRFSGLRDSWIFYHTKHYLAPQLWYFESLSEFGTPLTIRLGLGPAISFLVPSESASYYPGLSDAYSLFKESFEAYLGFSIELGLEYELGEHLRLGGEYLFIADSASDLAGDVARYGLDYFRRSGNFVFLAGVRL